MDRARSGSRQDLLGYATDMERRGGPLMVTALGGGQFDCAMVQGASKWDTARISLTLAVDGGQGTRVG